MSIGICGVMCPLLILSRRQKIMWFRQHSWIKRVFMLQYTQTTLTIARIACTPLESSCCLMEFSLVQHLYFQVIFLPTSPLIIIWKKHPDRKIRQFLHFRVVFLKLYVLLERMLLGLCISIITPMNNILQKSTLNPRLLNHSWQQTTKKCIWNCHQCAFNLEPTSNHNILTWLTS